MQTTENQNSGAAENPKSFESYDIYSRIPQRPPFLFMDQIIDIGSHQIRTELKLKGDEAYFKGHFPGNPVMPGVLMCEACFQAAAALLADPSNPSSSLGVVSKIEQTKFKRMAIPGDHLYIEVTKIESIANAHYLKGKISVDGKVIMQTKFTVAAVSTL